MNFILVIIKNHAEVYMGSIEARSNDDAMFSAIEHLTTYHVIGDDDTYKWFPDRASPILFVSHPNGSETIYKVIPASNIHVPKKYR